VQVIPRVVNLSPENPDDSLLARQARAGSSAAFEELVHRYHGRVFGFLLTLTRQRQDAEDLTQETFVRAWKKIDRFDAGRPLLPWLLTIGRRLSIARLRKVRPLPRELPFPAEPEPVRSGRWLWDVARHELSEDAYAALWLHYCEDLPLREVGRILGKREGAVKVMLHRARKTLADCLRGGRAAEAEELSEPQRSMP